MAGKGHPKRSGKSPGARTRQNDTKAAAETAREASESQKARNAEASIRERMVRIGRGNQQAGRQNG
jgi:hypothetical protein